MSWKLIQGLGAMFVLLGSSASAGFDGSYVIDQKHADDTAGYFSSPHQIKAKAFWEEFKIIDDTILTTIPVATQVGFAASSETADVYVPVNYEPDRPVGIYIHMNAGDTAHMPASYQDGLNDVYCIGASPDHAGNARHDPWRIARALDLVASLKSRYNVDEQRIYIGGNSGGALISMLAGMIYPEVFSGIIPTEHVMISSFWQKVFTTQDIAEMAAQGQRWAFIIGAESYAFSYMNFYTAVWQDTSGFQTLRTIVSGMGHSQPPPDVLTESIKWVDSPVQRQRAASYPDWLAYSFDDSHPGGLRGITEDFDGDGTDNGTEYLLGLDPTWPEELPAALALRIDGREMSLRYRQAIDAQVQVDVSTDLENWDESGEAIEEMLDEQSTSESEILAAGSTWRHLADGSDQGTAWRESGFDDGTWSETATPAGYGRVSDTDLVSPAIDYGSSSNNRYLTTYFRTTVNIADPALIRTLTFALNVDDGAVVYVNGQEVLRDGFDAGTIVAYDVAADASGNEGVYDEFTVSKEALIAGSNCIAVELHQVTAGSSDLGFDMSVTATPLLGSRLATLRFAAKDPVAPQQFFRARVGISELTNLARLPATVATQSSTTNSGAASRAIDGNRDGSFSSGSVTETSGTSASWWNLDLGATHQLRRISIFNRDTSQSRLSNFRVSVLDAGGEEVTGKTFHTAGSHVAGFHHWDVPGGIEGRAVKISLLSNGVLSLAEVEVIGLEADSQ